MWTVFHALTPCITCGFLHAGTSEIYPLISHESAKAKCFKPCAHKPPFTRERSPNHLDVVEKSHHRRKA